MTNKIERLDRATVQTLSVKCSNRQDNLQHNEPHHAAKQAVIQRRQQLVSRVRLGARVIYELPEEVDRHHGTADDIDLHLERYARLNADALAALGADRFLASPIRKVRQ